MRPGSLAVIAFALAAFLAPVRPAAAHCDTTRGPVVTAARAALAEGDVRLVLHWVRAEDEGAIRAVFDQTMKVRALGPEAQALADRFFFETLVRLHRAGEGAPYTGLTDQEPEPIIAAVDRALERGSADELERELVGAVRSGLAERFAAARATRNFRPGDVAAGRAYVAAYVPLTHWVEGVITSAEGKGEHHAAGQQEETEPHRAAPAAGTSGSSGTSGSDLLRALPWTAAALLAIAALIEGAFLLRHRRRLAH